MLIDGAILLVVLAAAAVPGPISGIDDGGPVIEPRALHRFLRRRTDRSAATGLLLTCALLFVAAALASFGGLLEMVNHGSGLARWDMSVARWGAAHVRGAQLTALRVVTQLGGTPLIIAVTVVVALLDYRRMRTRSGPLFIVTVVVSQLALANLIKALVGRARPDIAASYHAVGSSFPSGHSTAAAATYAAIALLLGRNRSVRARALLAGGAVVIAVVVATTRVLLGVHWLTDVIAGLLLGWSCFVLCAVAFGGRLLQFGAPLDGRRTPGESTPELVPADGDAR